MTNIMRKPEFFEGLIVAFLFSSLSTAAVVILGGYFLGLDVFRLIVSAMTFFYVTYLLMRSDQKTGRISVIVFGGLITGLSFFFVGSLLFFIMIQLGIVWLVRSLYFYQNIFQSLADIILMVLAILASAWAWLSTGNLFLASWCFFIFQALFIYIPRRFSLVPGKPQTGREKDRFEHAFYVAEQAAERLFRRH